MENFTDKDVKDFADKLFDEANKATAGHIVEPENIDIDKAKSFEQLAKKQIAENEVLHISDVMFSVSQPYTKYWVDLAMKIVSKDVRLPKCVRDGLVKKH